MTQGAKSLAGTLTSTLLPSLIIPNLSPLLSSSPSDFHGIIVLARAPDICITSTINSSARLNNVRTLFKRADELIVEVMQISGALARTIIPWKSEGDELRRGERFGMIRLGSRVDVRVPAKDFAPCVISAEEEKEGYPKGEFVKAGSTILYRGI